MDYIFIDTPLPEDDPNKHFGSFVPYNLFILDNILKKASYKGEVIFGKQAIDNLFSHNNHLNPDMIGISCTTYSRFMAIDIINKSRHFFPKSKIIVGGVHFGKCAEDSLKNIPNIDIVVRGDGDDIIKELLRYSKNERDLTSLEGISYRNANGSIVSPGNKLIANKLDDYSFINREYDTRVFKNNWLHITMQIPSLSLITGRGCPFGCIFCSLAKTKHRNYEIDSIMEAVDNISGRYDIKAIRFEDDSITLNENNLMNLCQQLKNRNIIWWCRSRADIRFEILEEMYVAGCRFISVGLETASPKIQKIIGKNISNADVLNFAESCSKLGIFCNVYLMASLPDETPQDLQLSLDFTKVLSKKFGVKVGSPGVATIYPGTKLEYIAKQRGIIPEDFSWSADYYNPINIEYNQFPFIPIYIEHITPEIFKKAQNQFRANYASTLDFKVFLRQSYEFLFKKHITWNQKLKTVGHFINEKLSDLKLKS